MIFRSNIRLGLSFLLFVGFLQFGLGQNILTSIHSQWDDSASEWTIYGIDESHEEIEGSFRIKWILRNDFSEWVADFDDTFMSIKRKFGNDNTRWELRSDSGIITDMKAKWRGDYTEWTITGDNTSIVWQSEYKNDLNVWFFEDKDQGWMEMRTISFNDTRDWEIIDETLDVSDEIKMACVFLSLYHTTPKQ